MQDGKCVQCDSIPRTWYKTIKTESGRPDLVAATVLGYVQQEYRLAGMRGDADELDKLYSTGLDVGYARLHDELGLTKEQLRHALGRLEALGVLRRRFRTDYVMGQLASNVMSLELDFGALEAVTFPKEG